MGFKPASQMPQQRANQIDEPEASVRARLETRLKAVKTGTSIEFVGLKGHEGVIRDLKAAGYQVAFPYRDMGHTAVVSWG